MPGKYFIFILLYDFLLTSWQVRLLCQAQGQVRKGPRKTQAACMHEVHGAQRVVRVAGDQRPGSGSGQREGQGEGGHNVAARRGETEEEEDSHEDRR